MPPTAGPATDAICSMIAFEADCILEDVPGHQRGQHRLSCRAVKGARHGAEAGEGVDRKGMREAVKRECRQRQRGDSRRTLRDEHHAAAIPHIRNRAAGDREEDDRHQPDEAHHPSASARRSGATSSDTCHKIAAICIIDPENEISWPVQSNRKLRCCSAISEERRDKGRTV